MKPISKCLVAKSLRRRLKWYLVDPVIHTIEVGDDLRHSLLVTKSGSASMRKKMQNDVALGARLVDSLAVHCGVETGDEGVEEAVRFAVEPAGNVLLRKYFWYRIGAAGEIRDEGKRGIIHGAVCIESSDAESSCVASKGESRFRHSHGSAFPTFGILAD